MSGLAPELPALTGLRAVAAVWVSMTHIQGLNNEPLWFLARGYLGVDIFFILSGFVLTHVYGEAFRHPSWPEFRRYLGLRLGRIWPGYLTVLVIIVAISAGVGAMGRQQLPQLDSTYWFTALVHGLMLQSWGLGVEVETFNGPAWSVSSEMVGYVLLPVLIAMVWRCSWRGMAMVLVAAAASVILASLMHADGLRAAVGINGMPRALGEFVAGIVLYRMSTGTASLPWDRIGWLALSLVATIVAISPAASHYDLPVIVGLAALVPCLAHADGSLHRFFTHPALLWLGKISYGIFLTHILAILIMVTIAKRIGWPDAPFSARAVALIVAAMALTLGAGAALYYLVEHPARQWVRRRIGSHP